MNAGFLLAGLAPLWISCPTTAEWDGWLIWTINMVVFNWCHSKKKGSNQAVWINSEQWKEVCERWGQGVTDLPVWMDLRHKDVVKLTRLSLWKLWNTTTPKYRWYKCCNVAANWHLSRFRQIADDLSSLNSVKRLHNNLIYYIIFVCFSSPLMKVEEIGIKTQGPFSTQQWKSHCCSYCS